MDFSWPQEYQDYREKVIAFAKEELQDDVLARDKTCTFGEDLWQKCADFGILALAATKEYGGEGDKVDVLKSVVAMEALGYACKDTGLISGLNAQMWAVQMALLTFGTEEQKQKYLPLLVSGKWYGAHGLTEEEAGSDVFSMQMRAEKVEGGYILNGEKRLITLGPIANLALIFANAKPNQSKWGITAFLVENTFEGYTASPAREKLGLRTTPLGEITLKNCFVPDENRLGREGAGLSITNHSLEYDRCFILTGKLGAMERQLEETVAFAKKRVQFGQSISKFQAVSHRIVDMKVRYETSRLLIYKLAWLKHHNKSAMLEAAMSKLFLSENYLESSLHAVRTRGGNAFLSDYEVDRYLRDATGGVLYAGTSDIQKNIIAKFLGL
jgi:alkylation response protein AidB-like acyl-CoA dehydrogenase